MLIERRGGEALIGSSTSARSSRLEKTGWKGIRNCRRSGEVFVVGCNKTGCLAEARTVDCCEILHRKDKNGEASRDRCLPTVTIGRPRKSDTRAEGIRVRIEQLSPIIAGVYDSSGRMKLGYRNLRYWARSVCRSSGGLGGGRQGGVKAAYRAIVSFVKGKVVIKAKADVYRQRSCYPPILLCECSQVSIPCCGEDIAIDAAGGRQSKLQCSEVLTKGCSTRRAGGLGEVGAKHKLSGGVPIGDVLDPILTCIDARLENVIAEDLCSVCEDVEAIVPVSVGCVVWCEKATESGLGAADLIASSRASNGN